MIRKHSAAEQSLLRERDRGASKRPAARPSSSNESRARSGVEWSNIIFVVVALMVLSRFEARVRFWKISSPHPSELVGWLVGWSLPWASGRRIIFVTFVPLSPSIVVIFVAAAVVSFFCREMTNCLRGACSSAPPLPRLPPPLVQLGQGISRNKLEYASS